MEITEIHFDSIGSTNLYAKENCASFAPDEVTVITADEQTAGRGRYQRKMGLSQRSQSLRNTLLPIASSNHPLI